MTCRFARLSLGVGVLVSVAVGYGVARHAGQPAEPRPQTERPAGEPPAPKGGPKVRVRVACLGDSITEGTYGNVYPTLLGESLGDGFEVRNFGVGAATLLAGGDKPYAGEKAYTKAIDFKPNIAVVLLGTNDSKKESWRKAGDFGKDYAALLAPFEKLDPKPRLLLCTPPPIQQDNWGLQGKVVTAEVGPKVAEAARGHTLIDVHAAFKARKGSLFSDGVHPNAAGAKLLAATVRKAVAPGTLPVGPDGQAVGDCLAMIHGCQLADGAIVQVRHGTEASAPVWVAPYFAHHAALALLAGYDERAAPDDLAAVGRWLAWCAANQAADGYWTDFTGTVGEYKSNGKVDAWDSSAALFLIVADRYRRAGGKPTEAVLAAAKKAFGCLVSVTDADGMTWAKPSYKVKFLMDNIETYAGYRAAADLFAATGAAADAATARTAAAATAKALPGFWLRDQRLFSYALHENGRFEGGLCCAYPHGLAQLYGLAFVSPLRTDAWGLTAEKFAPDGGPTANAGAEWWLVAAARLDRKDLGDWKVKVGKEVEAWKAPAAKKVYVNRAAVAVLALLEGADWMPSVADDDR